MLLKEMMEDERAIGRNEGIELGLTQGKANAVLLFLEALGKIPNNLKTQILSTTNAKLLDQWLFLAGKAAFVEEFAEKAGLELHA